MQLWFINGRYFESENKQEILNELCNSFYRGLKLDSAGCYKTADLVELLLLASGNIDNDFLTYIVEDLRLTRRDCLQAEQRVKELMNEIKQLKERLNHAK